MATAETNVKLSEETEAAVVYLFDTIFEGIAYISPDVLHKNLLLASGGMSKDDRTIKVEIANFLIKNFGILYFGFILSNDLRDMCVRAVDGELCLENVSAEDVASYRNATLVDGVKTKPSKGNYVIDFSSFNNETYKAFSTGIFESIKSLGNSGLDDDIDGFMDYAVNELSADSMMRIGFCVSNFMYFIRACAKNEMFYQDFHDYLKTIKNNLANTATIN